MLLCSLPAAAFAAKDDAHNAAIESYVSARLAEITNRDGDALKAYVKLHKSAPDSEVLSDRLLVSAVRAGDMPSAVRAVRALELKKAVSNEAPLLLFADAFKRKNWAMASVASSELENGSYFGFMAPILRAWIEIAQGKPFDLPDADPKDEPFYAYYASDQRIYMELATGKHALVKPTLRALALSNIDFARDLLLRAAPIYAAQGEGDYAAALVNATAESDYAALAGKRNAKDPQARLSAEEGAGILHARIAEALIDQDSPEQALIFARIAQWLAPNNDAVRLTLAKAMETQDMDDMAVAVRSSISVASPYWPRAISASLAQLGSEKRFDDAVKLAANAQKQRPQSANMAVLLGQYQQESGDTSGAIATYRKLIDEADNARANPRQRAVYKMLLGMALDNSGDWNAARNELDQARELDPENPSILNYLGYSLLERGGDVQLAGTLIEKAHSLSPKSTAITDSMGWAKYHQGQYQEAVGFLETAAMASGTDATINEHLGDAYWRAGRRIEARYAWRVAAQTASETDSLRLAMKLNLGLPEVAAKP